MKVVFPSGADSELKTERFKEQEQLIIDPAIKVAQANSNIELIFAGEQLLDMERNH